MPCACICSHSGSTGAGCQTQPETTNSHDPVLKRIFGIKRMANFKAVMRLFRRFTQHSNEAAMDKSMKQPVQLQPLRFRAWHSRAIF